VKRGEWVYAKLHRTPNSVVLACCGKEWVGKVLEDERHFFEVKASFYQGQLVDEAGLEKLLLEADNINLFGDKPVRVALAKGFIKESDVIRVKGVPHTNIFKFR